MLRSRLSTPEAVSPLPGTTQGRRDFGGRTVQHQPNFQITSELGLTQ